jgi:hypothetical protein
MTPQETKEWLWARCTCCGDCLLWDGAVAKGGVPMVRDPDTAKVTSARRLLLIAMGVEVEGMLATTNCGNPLCMTEKHAIARSRKWLQKRIGKDNSTNIKRSAALAIARRKTAILTMDLVRQARSAGMKGPQMVEAYGCSLSAAYSALRGRTWKEYGGPFASFYPRS